MGVSFPAGAASNGCLVRVARPQWEWDAPLFQLGLHFVCTLSGTDHCPTADVDVLLGMQTLGGSVVAPPASSLVLVYAWNSYRLS